MKKAMRIFTLVLSAAILVFGCFILHDELTNYNFLTKLKNDLTLLIPVHLTLFSCLSMLYTIQKFRRRVFKKSRLYTFLRISDFIFSIPLFIFGLFGAYFLTQSTILDGGVESDANFFMLRIVVISLILTLSVLLFIDNLKFHKFVSTPVKTDTIEDIGQRD
ncbi:hypothetical protein RQM59_08545 [Flavobacteriaceae bacterium S356]|uniref:Lipoprotein n=1 Tax=Asprobacillus argus TaxID=3076534 RepID=A0ABU3LGK4_9FLAO|nr:hypothetical protein [Flavobacteriaceae bacterium S356]